MKYFCLWSISIVTVIIYVCLFIWFPRSRFHLLHPGHHYREIHDCLPSILQGQSRGIIRPAAKLLKSLLIHPKLSHSVQCQHKCTHWDTDFIDILEAVAGEVFRYLFLVWSKPICCYDWYNHIWHFYKKGLFYYVLFFVPTNSNLIKLIADRNFNLKNKWRKVWWGSHLS